MNPRSSLSLGRLGLAVLVVLAALAALVAVVPDGPARGGGMLDALTGVASSSAAPEGSGRVHGLIPVSADHEALTRLDPALLAAVRSAARDAARDGVRLRISSGWRSRAYQQRLLDEAVEEYGSAEEARRWVETPDGSAHTRGDAVDVGPTDAAYWLMQHGSENGLCQVYANEIWHFELTTEPGTPCPPARADGRS